MKTAVSSKTDRHSEMRRVFRQLRRNRLSMLGLLIILFFLLCAILAPLLAPYNPAIPNFAYALRQPSPQHLLGTDELGRNLLSRMLFGARTSLGIGFISVIIGAAAGVPLGALSGYYGGKLDLLLQRGIDVLIAFPGILLAIIVVSIMGVGLENAMIAIGVASIPVYTRLTRGSVLALKEMEYITAAKALGLSDARIITRHILPNCLSPLIVQSTFQVATAILWAAGLGFLGLGAQPPSPEWGAMLSRGRVFMRTYPFLTTIPGLAIFLVVLGFNLFGDGLRDSLDPRARKY